MVQDGWYYNMAVTISGSDGGAAVTTATQKVVKTAYFETGTFATTTAQIPFDATIPQITEGAEFMTLAYTPLNANNILRITYLLWTARFIEI